MTRYACSFVLEAEEEQRTGMGVIADRQHERRMQRRGPCAAVLIVLEERLSGIPVHVQVCR